MGNYSSDYLNQILECFIPDRTFQISPLHIGFINDTFMVLSQAQPLYILQRINHQVFKNVDGLMSNISLALRKLGSSDYRTIELTQSPEKKLYHHDENGYWRLMTYIPNSITYNTTTEDRIAFEAGRIIGRFHLLLTDANPNEFVDTIPEFHDLEARHRQFILAKATAQPGNVKAAQKAIDFAEKTITQLAPLMQATLPTRICHNDTKLNNILFSKNTKTALCLIDLDTIMKGHFYFDFGDAIRSIVNTAPEDEKNLDKITFQQHLFSAFVDGLALHKAFLSPEEIRTLPLGVVFMPFIHGLRALTDYLNNNIYYKVTYENQNLDRAFSLFEFTKKALGQMDFMQRTVNGKLI